MKILSMLFVLLFTAVCFGQDAGIPLEAVEVPVVPDAGLFVKILAWVVAVNLLLGGVSAFLGKIKDMTKTDADNKLYDILSKVSGGLQKVVDFASNNTKPKEEKK